MEDIMIKLRNMIVAVIAITSISIVSHADIGFGVTGSFATVEASGSDRDKTATADTSTRTGTASNVNALVGSVFAEYITEGGWALGIDYVPGAADVSGKARVRNTQTENVKEAKQEDGNYTANAEIKNYLSLYADIPVGGSGMYGKIGYVQVDVDSKESFSGTSASTGFGNDSTDGYMFGAGYKSDLGPNSYYKLEGSHTMFDTMTFVGVDTDKGTDITADFDVTKLTFALGYKF
jgi:hypothetical protein